MAKKSRVNKLSENQSEQIPNSQKSQKKEQFSLYLFLQIEKSATPYQLVIIDQRYQQKKQYRKLVLKYHPDKNKQDPEAKQKFQKLKQAYDILSNPEKRKIYDQTGSTGEDLFDENAFQSAYDYFRSVYKKVTKEDIHQFQKQYRQGPMQQEDLLSYYEQHQGNMIQLIQSIPLSLNEDIPRFISFFEEKIIAKQIQKFKAFDKTKNKVRLLKDESEELKKEQQKCTNQLIIAIRGKNTINQKDFLSAFEQKYAPKKTKANKENLIKQKGIRKSR